MTQKNNKKENMFAIFSGVIIIIIVCVLFKKGTLIDFLNRVGMNGILVLSMVPTIICGVGLNFGISIGILCGLFGGVLSIEIGLTGILSFVFAVFIGTILSAITGILYGKLLNVIKGDEMTVGTYVGFSMVSLMSIAWVIFPFKSPDMVWTIGGKGLRTTISLENSFGGVLGVFGSIFIFILLCILLYGFLHTKTGIAMKTAGIKPKYALNCGIKPDKYRILGVMISNIFGAIGILVYSSGYGFLQLYQAPLMMPFAAVAGVLIGGATIKKASVLNALLGVCIFQFLMTVSTPFINSIFSDSSLSDSVRMVISYGVVLFALLRQGGRRIK